MGDWEGWREGAGLAGGGVRNFHRFVILLWRAKSKRLCVREAAGWRDWVRTAKEELQRLNSLRKKGARLLWRRSRPAVAGRDRHRW